MLEGSGPFQPLAGFQTPITDQVDESGHDHHGEQKKRKRNAGAPGPAVWVKNAVCRRNAGQTTTVPPSTNAKNSTTMAPYDASNASMSIP